MRDTQMPFFLRLFLSVMVMTLASRSMCAQQTPIPSTDTTTLHVASRLVVLDVVVIDRNGRFVLNVDRSQFTVTEDQVPQAIRSFDPPDGHEMPAGPAGKMLVESSEDLPKIGKAPVNILVFDEVNTPFLQLAYVRQMMERYLKRMPDVLAVPTLFIAASAKKIAVARLYPESCGSAGEYSNAHNRCGFYDAHKYSERSQVGLG